ncbi:hypothetical protein WKW50_13655 [Ochrobactrum sp. GPK 3]|uniref:Uncharacterized protein n=1 Tax=Brucella haematophila TaxID=419474 RepID=A0ABX1DMN1_9HYPH|nr:hypothetical protein [Brucella haematophila]KAB2700237.1 hypothetical protein F9K79_04885 [Ochrobactrum sp. Kaboul]MBA8820598.1 hypothetical protein [Ochrobactrum sp. P6BSIII]MDH7786037.1 hypothetical protein [Ochrobactrum sp. 19YEA23]OOL16643.1 hypothetical protein BRY73_12855 [Ochrobactrum sp. P6BS-III]NKC04221.1 hypothetical protein [Brucella haematophila]
MRIHLTFLATALLGLNTAQAAISGQSLDITVENSGKTSLACSAAFAHWFSADLGEVAPGASRSFSFGVDVKTGNVFQLNSVGDKMAVQRIWCGHKGDDWATRAEIPMERRAGVTPEPVHLRCEAGVKATRCAAP